MASLPADLLRLWWDGEGQADADDALYRLSARFDNLIRRGSLFCLTVIRIVVLKISGTSLNL